MNNVENNKELNKRIGKRILDSRMRLLKNYPFYGNLLLHLGFSLAKCGTAATNMVKVYFDPEFVEELSDNELDFVLMHEVLHCALQHCLRGREKNTFFFNLACDIVVNSNIMQSIGAQSFIIAGEEVVHKAPDGMEGWHYTAEDVYDMLMGKYQALVSEVEYVLDKVRVDYGVGFDEHELWKTIPLDTTLSEEWKKHLIDAVQNITNSHVPPQARDLIEDFNRKSKLDWREVLHDFIKVINDNYDYFFVPPDKRFSYSDFFLPSFSESDAYNMVEDLWFVADTSGSVSSEMLTAAIYEIKSAIGQFEHLSAKLSYFDTSITEPVLFDSVKTLEEIPPMGGGGTDFFCIFNYMKEYMSDDLPVAVIILTDGYAIYPDEEAAMGVPVLWIISNNNEKAPWGTSILIDDKDI